MRRTKAALGQTDADEVSQPCNFRGQCSRTQAAHLAIQQEQVRVTAAWAAGDRGGEHEFGKKKAKRSLISFALTSFGWIRLVAYMRAQPGSTTAWQSTRTVQHP